MNNAIWNALSKTDPAHTKSFSRAGGFKGTAIKPIWTVKRLTDQFGACGVGWGMHEPHFQVVQGDGELLVYCTVTCWHTDRENTFVGVGGDKVTTKRQSGSFNDDEAFKKAFTDAVGNAFKFIGVGADVHMGLFEDSKYLREVEREFAEPPQAQAKKEPAHSALKTKVRAFVHALEGCGDGSELDGFLYDSESQSLIAELKAKIPSWWEGGEGEAPEFIPLKNRIDNKQYEFARRIADNATV